MANCADVEAEPDRELLLRQAEPVAQRLHVRRFSRPHFGMQPRHGERPLESRNIDDARNLDNDLPIRDDGFDRPFGSQHSKTGAAQREDRGYSVDASSIRAPDDDALR